MADQSGYKVYGADGELHIGGYTRGVTGAQRLSDMGGSPIDHKGHGHTLSRNILSHVAGIPVKVLTAEYKKVLQIKTWNRW